MEIANSKDTSRVKDVTDRIFHNSEVTEARGAYAGRKAMTQHMASFVTINAAQAVASGFQRAVEKMNLVFTNRLDEI